ncbi:hypothetical protein [Achromobacter marplatensis]|uniref:hypothetical protein n=1 Tax=Achromobacter marplatensis TaxID=470868 RepID=UPI001178CD27|nr:hypothetical protein [Achromobacter marplatensis]
MSFPLVHCDSAQHPAVWHERGRQAPKKNGQGRDRVDGRFPRSVPGSARRMALLFQWLFIFRSSNGNAFKPIMGWEPHKMPIKYQNTHEKVVLRRIRLQ